MKVIIITAADAKYFDLVKDTILSVRNNPQGKNIAIGFLDLGCNEEQLKWLQTTVNIIVKPDWHFDFPAKSESPEYFKGLFARPFLRQYFANFDVYCWIDADAWVQDWEAIDLLIQGAFKKGLAVVPEIDRCYNLPYGKLPWYWQFTHRDYENAFNKEIADQLYSYPTINAGVFALHHQAPHWEFWAKYLSESLQKYCSIMSDQIVLNFLVYGTNLREKTELLPAWCNWSCNSGLPFWDHKNSCFVEPFLPHKPIGIIHLTGKKHDLIQLPTTDQNLVEVNLRYQSTSKAVDEDFAQRYQPYNQNKSSQIEQSTITNRLNQSIINNPFPKGDYVSPNLQIIKPDLAFPNMIIGNTTTCQWVYLRREIPHNWYIDKRHPHIGFLSRDEAHILYNNALQFKGKNALEIGCWMGWSATHLVLAGVNLDIIDPILAKSEIRDSVIYSIQTAAQNYGVVGQVALIPGYSPQKVEEIANQSRKKWSLIFIDGNHDAPGPLNDAIACEKYAEDDAMILFHDLSAPDVAQGLDYLRDRGWQTMIYQTMQIMGVAWRGHIEPVNHQPDPNVNWTLPEHLQKYPVSSRTKRESYPIIQQRNLNTELPPQTMLSIQRGSLKYSYRDIRMVKNPFDFALYPLLLWNLKPKTIIEIGSFCGGSAVWFADILNTFDIDGHIYSIDITKIEGVNHPMVTFMEGSGRDLQKILTPNFLNSLPRPLLVIEDADHFYETTIQVLEFFHKYLRHGEYIVVEDGIISDMGDEKLYNGGPKKALKEFLLCHYREYEIDSFYCDFFGHNFTWCTNGFLKKLDTVSEIEDSNAEFQQILAIRPDV